MNDPDPVHNDKTGRFEQESEKELDEIKRLLFARELVQLENLRERLENPNAFSRNVSHVLPEAIMGGTRRDRRLAAALSPAVEDIFKTLIRKDVKSLADLLFPVMGPAIRKSIAHMFRRMLQSFNEALERSLSWKGLKWRVEAWRTGRPFAEVVLIHSLVYRVEQIFLIHKETGLLLQHATLEGVVAQDGDIVSGMLTAIRDFVRDSFDASENDSLETLRLGELNILIEQGPRAILAAVVRGDAPGAIVAHFQNALEIIHLELNEPLESFDGDPAPFDEIKPLIEDCLKASYKPRKHRFSPFFWVVLFLAISAVVFLIVRETRKHARYRHFMVELTAASGVAAVSARKNDGRYVVTGLKDPLAPPFESIFRRTGMDERQVVFRFSPFVSLEPEIVLKRAGKMLNPPDSVQLSLKDGILTARGSAPHRWIIESRRIGPLAPGIDRYNDDGLKNIDLERSRLLKGQIESAGIDFESNEIEPAAGQTVLLDSVAEKIRLFLQVSDLAGKSARVEIVGRSDGSGVEERNILLSRQRAESVRSHLVSRGLPGDALSARGVGSNDPLTATEHTDKDKKINRRTSFRTISSK